MGRSGHKAFGSVLREKLKKSYYVKKLKIRRGDNYRSVGHRRPRLQGKTGKIDDEGSS